MVNKKEIISELQNRLSSLLEESDAIAKLLRLYGGNDIKLPSSIGNGVTIPATHTKDHRISKNSCKRLKLIISELQRTGDLQSWFTIEDLYGALKKSSSKPKKERVYFPLSLKFTTESIKRDKQYMSSYINGHRRSYNKELGIVAIKMYGAKMSESSRNQFIYTIDKENFVFNHITPKSEVALKTLPEKYKSQLSNPAVWIEIK